VLALEVRYDADSAGTQATVDGHAVVIAVAKV
jgi:hypothetical protein